MFDVEHYYTLDRYCKIFVALVLSVLVVALIDKSSIKESVELTCKIKCFSFVVERDH